MLGAGVGGGDIDMAGISSRITNAATIDPRDAAAQDLISGGVNTGLFAYDKGSIDAYDEDLDAVLRSRGHPGLHMPPPRLTMAPQTSKPAGRRQTTGEIGLTATADSAVAGMPATGDEAVEFFGRKREDSEVKVLFLIRASTGLDFRPYDLAVVDRTEIEPEHFTMSASGVVHIQPGQPSQFTLRPNPKPFNPIPL